MNSFNWKSTRESKQYLLLYAIPWATLILLILLFHMISGALTRSEGVLFDLPNSTFCDGATTDLVALVLPQEKGQTLIFFDDARFLLGDETSEKLFRDQLSERSIKTDDKTLLILADKRVLSGELMSLASRAKEAGIQQILFAERREINEAEYEPDRM